VRSRAGIGLTAVLAGLALATPAHALTPTITEFSSGLTTNDSPLSVATGPDGNVWFADGNTSAGSVGRITPAGTITKFSTGLNSGSRPFHITAGPDGNLWFTDRGSTPAIGRIDPSGHIDEFSAGLDPGASLSGITTGPDGNVWFTDHGTTPAIGRITPTGRITELPGLPSTSSPLGIAAGPDGNLWFTDQGTPTAIGRITPTGSTEEFRSGLDPVVPAEIAPGPDGNLWFTDDGGAPAIGRITPTGHITEFSAGLRGTGSSPFGIVAGPDGALWFGDEGRTPTPGAIGHAVTSGGIDEFNTGLNVGSKPAGVTLGPDGNIWFGDIGTTPAIGFITTPPAVTTVSAVATGSTTAAVLALVDGHAQPTTFHVEFGVLGGSLSSTGGHNLGTTTGPTHVTAALSRLRPNTTYQARAVGVNPTDATDGPFVTFTTGPPADRITRMSLRPKVFVPASRGATVRSARAPGALISYVGTQPATTIFTVEHAVQGRRRGRNCVKRNRRNRHARPCSLLVTVGSFRHTDRVGRVRFRFTGRLHHRALRPGNYRLDAEPHSAGGIGRVVRKSFGVKPAPRKHHKKG
jgi:streptogramin lyase